MQEARSGLPTQSSGSRSRDLVPTLLHPLCGPGPRPWNLLTALPAPTCRPHRSGELVDLPPGSQPGLPAPAHSPREKKSVEHTCLFIGQTKREVKSLLSKATRLRLSQPQKACKVLWTGMLWACQQTHFGKQSVLRSLLKVGTR